MAGVADKEKRLFAWLGTDDCVEMNESLTCVIRSEGTSDYIHKAQVNRF